MAIDTSSVSSTVLSQYSGTDTSSSDSSSLGKTDFMMLLVTQLNNQNPLDPQDNSEFVAQLAQFSSLESMENLNASMTSLLSTYQSSQALQATSLVGSSVIVETGSALVDTSESLSGTVVMPSSGSNVNVKIYDSTGSLVKTISLGIKVAATSISFGMAPTPVVRLSIRGPSPSWRKRRSTEPPLRSVRTSRQK